MAKTLGEYLALPYSITLRRDVRDDIFVARVVEIPSCSAHGATEQEALQNLKENMAIWIADALEEGDPIPLPSDTADLPSGKWLQRVPRNLHRKLIDLAKAEETSLNQLVATMLAEALGERRGKRDPLVIEKLQGFGEGVERIADPIRVHYMAAPISLASEHRGGKRVTVDLAMTMESFAQVLSSHTPSHQEIRLRAAAESKEKSYAYQA